MEIRGAGDAPAAPRARPAARPRRRAGPVPAGGRRGAPSRRAPSSFVAVRPRRRAARRPRRRPGPLRARARPASRSSTTGPARRAWRTRPTSSSTSAWPTGSTNIPYLATAFSTNDDIEAAGLGRLAPVHDPDELEEAGRVRRVHRARRAADGRDDAALPATTGPTSSPARCRSSRSPRPATSGTARTRART